MIKLVDDKLYIDLTENEVLQLISRKTDEVINTVTTELTGEDDSHTVTSIKIPSYSTLRIYADQKIPYKRFNTLFKHRTLIGSCLKYDILTNRSYLDITNVAEYDHYLLNNDRLGVVYQTDE